MKYIITTVFLLAYSALSFSIDRTIKVLAVYTPSVPESRVILIDRRLKYLSDIWQKNSLIESTGVALEVVNNGNPIPINAPSGTGVKSTLIAALAGAAREREKYEADFVLVFAEDIEECGYTESDTWVRKDGPGSFIPDPSKNNLDLRGELDSYGAIINLDCRQEVVAHELGHLLGGGHYDINQNNYLFPDSHSFQRVDSVTIPEVGYIAWTVQTLITSEADCYPIPLGGRRCLMTDYFSSILPGREGDANHNNLRAVQKTALSAANFRPIVESRPPVLKPPINLEFSFKVKDCDPAPYTSHWLIWQDHPDTTVEVDRYEVWYFQPPRNGYIYGWGTDTPSSPGYGVGADASVKVKACTSNECSALSSSTYFASWTCRG